MSLVHNYSNPIIRSQVDLFSVPPTDTTVETSFYEEFKPIVNITDSNAKIEFRIVGNSSHYLDFSDHFLYVKLRVIAEDDTNLAADDEISIVNLSLHSLFSQCDVLINNHPITDGNNCYGYKSMIETLLSFGPDYQDSQGSAALFFKDDTKIQNATSNSGYSSRKDYVKESKVLNIITSL